MDSSRYKKTHNDVVSFVKEQVGVDLNKYRSGDGSSPSHTTYWDKSGPKVAFDLKGMTSSDRTKLMQLAQKPFGVTVEQGGAWIGFAGKSGRAGRCPDIAGSLDNRLFSGQSQRNGRDAGRAAVSKTSGSGGEKPDDDEPDAAQKEEVNNG